jgi:hypothetical protein
MTAGFTALLVTTRNVTLDSLMAEHCFGAEPVPAGVRKTELCLGEVVPAQTMSLNRPPQHTCRLQVCVPSSAFRLWWNVWKTHL